MKNIEFFVLVSSRPTTGTAERLGTELVEVVLMFIKTTAARLEAARLRLVELRPYEVPEMVALPVADGHHAHLEWVSSSTRTPQP